MPPPLTFQCKNSTRPREKSVLKRGLRSRIICSRPVRLSTAYNDGGVFAFWCTATVNAACARGVESAPRNDRKSVVEGKSVSGSVDHGGSRRLKKKKIQYIIHAQQY